MNYLQAEVIFLGKLRHPHLVRLIGYCCEDERRLLVYEYMERESLENHLFKGKFTLIFLGSFSMELDFLRDLFLMLDLTRN